LLSSLYWCLKLEMTPHEVANDAERMPRLYTAHDISGGDCWKSLYLLKTIGPQVMIQIVGFSHVQCITVNRKVVAKKDWISC